MHKFNWQCRQNELKPKHKSVFRISVEREVFSFKMRAHKTTVIAVIFQIFFLYASCYGIISYKTPQEARKASSRQVNHFSDGKSSDHVLVSGRRSLSVLNLSLISIKTLCWLLHQWKAIPLRGKWFTHNWTSSEFVM